MTITTALFSDLQSINPSAVIELFTLQLSNSLHGDTTIYRFHAGSNLNANGQIVWKGQTYLRFPVSGEGWAYQRGQIPRPKFRVSNATGLVSALLLTVNETTTGNDLTGAILTRITTLAKFLDAVNFSNNQNPTANPNIEFPQEIYTVDRKASENRELVEFELAAPTDLDGVNIPGRQATRNLFPSIGTFAQ